MVMIEVQKGTGAQQHKGEEDEENVLLQDLVSLSLGVRR